MALFQRRRGPEPAPATPTTNGAAARAPARRRAAYFELKTRIHRQLIERLDLTKLALLPAEVVQQQIQRIVEDMLATEETPLSRQEREQLVGRGPARDLRARPDRAAHAGPDGLRHPRQRAPRTSTSSGAGSSSGPASCSATTRTSSRSSSASSRRWAGGWTSRRPWSMRGCPTARASTRSSRRWPWTAPCCRSAASPRTRCRMEDLLEFGHLHARAGRDHRGRACRPG